MRAPPQDLEPQECGVHADNVRICTIYANLPTDWKGRLEATTAGAAVAIRSLNSSGVEPDQAIGLRRRDAARFNASINWKALRIVTVVCNGVVVEVENE